MKSETNRIDFKEELPTEETFIFVVDNNPQLGIFKDDLIVSLTQKGKEYSIDKVDYWIKQFNKVVSGR